MKAILRRTYGPPDVLSCEEVEKPAAGDGEVLIRVRAASINPIDWHFMRGTPYPIRMGSGFRKPDDPRVGFDVAGQVETVGKNVRQFKLGDDVFGNCRGALAEYASASENSLAPKPANVSFEEAAAVPVAAVTALIGLRDKGGIQPGHQVLVDGASGGVGTFAIQIAKWFGADVTAVCSTGKQETARSIGADHVIDYMREDFTRRGQRYDLRESGDHAGIERRHRPPICRRNCWRRRCSRGLGRSRPEDTGTTGVCGRPCRARRVRRSPRSAPDSAPPSSA